MTGDTPDPRSTYGQAPDGQPQYGSPQYGSPQYGSPQYGSPQYGSPQYGSPQYGYGQPHYGQPQQAPQPRRRNPLPWIVAVVTVGAILVLGGTSLALWYGWQGRTTTTSAQTPVQAPASTTAPGTASPASPDSASAAPDSASAAPSSPGTSADGTSPSPGGAGAADRATSSWLAATNAYCRTTTDPAIKKASPLSTTDLAAYFARIAAINREVDTVLRKDPPSGLRAQVEQVASNWDRMATFFDQAAAALRKNDLSGAKAAAAQGDAANQLGNDLASRIGLQDCAQAGAIGGPASASSSPDPIV